MGQIDLLENYLYLIDLSIGKMFRMFTNSLGDLGSFPGRVIPNTQKNSTLFNTRPYKVRIKGKVEQSRERSSALLYTLV